MASFDIQALIWDEWNEAHIWERHQLVRAEIEEVCYGDPEHVLVEDTHHGRYRVIGPKRDGKILVVILAPEGEGSFYVVTAKQTKRQELRRYIDWKEKSNE